MSDSDDANRQNPHKRSRWVPVDNRGRPIQDYVPHLLDQTEYLTAVAQIAFEHFGERKVHVSVDKIMSLDPKYKPQAVEIDNRLAVRKNEQMEALERLREGLRQAEAAWHRLDPTLQQSIGDDARQRGGNVFYLSWAYRAWAHAIDVGERELHRAADIGRNTPKAVAVVDVARRWWAEATGKAAPERALNEGSPFAGFLADLLNVCGCDGSPRSAFNAWARIRHS